MRSIRMSTMERPGARGGWLMAELVVALVILGLLVVGMGAAEQAVRGSNALQLARQRCVAAAQAQFDALGAQGQPAPQAEIERLWPGIRTDLAVSDGRGQWQGLKLVTVTATGRLNSRVVRVQLARYYDRPVGIEP